MKKILFAIIGAILGIPLSYFFQHDIIKGVGIGNYLENFDKVLDQGLSAASTFSNIQDPRATAILSVVILTIVGGVIGYFFDKREKMKA